ncbi:hypothetical protein GCM10023317_12730 [Actinopolymorpha pittospori]
MDDIGCELGQGPPDRVVWQADRKLRVHGQGQAPDPDHGRLPVCLTPGTGRDDEGLVATLHQVIHQVAHGVRDPVDLGKERLCDDGYSHSRHRGRRR